ncbi:hypothetical protein GW17_00032896 [Ensete ventricosum]|nr:hypothetical protein GW17_00032896 [Ensete ventricosum]
MQRGKRTGKGEEGESEPPGIRRRKERGGRGSGMGKRGGGGGAKPTTCSFSIPLCVSRSGEKRSRFPTYMPSLASCGKLDIAVLHDSTDRSGSAVARRGGRGNSLYTLARPQSSRHGVGARSDGWKPKVWLWWSAVGVVELRSFVPNIFTAFIAYHIVGRTTTDAPIPVSNRLPRVGSTTSAGQLSEGAKTWRPGQHLSYHSFPPGKTFSRCPIRVLKMRSCAELPVCGDVRLVLKAGSRTDWIERGSGEGLVGFRTRELNRSSRSSGTDRTERGSRMIRLSRSSGTDQAGVDPTEQGLEKRTGRV